MVSIRKWISINDGGGELRIEHMPLDALKPATRNPKRHQVETVLTSRSLTFSAPGRVILITLKGTFPRERAVHGVFTPHSRMPVVPGKTRD